MRVALGPLLADTSSSEEGPVGVSHNRGLNSTWKLENCANILLCSLNVYHSASTSIHQKLIILAFASTVLTRVMVTLTVVSLIMLSGSLDGVNYTINLHTIL